MFNTKISNRQSGIVLYGITPPKSANTPEKTAEITQKTVSRVRDLDVDGLVIYDLQDESSRTAEERPFPFIKTIDAYKYASDWLNDLTIPKIIYCSVGKLSEQELNEMLNSCSNCNAAVFVGVPSKDYPVRITLPKAYKIYQDAYRHIPLGAVAIPERHSVKKTEHQKIFHKMAGGCSFFITQCVYNIEYVKNLVSDVFYHSQKNELEVPVLIFTLTPCGSLKTLNFLGWLGISVPQWLVNELTNSHNILAKSIDLCVKIAEEIIDFCAERNIPFGINIESVSIRKDEIEASAILLSSVNEMLYKKGIRKRIQ